MKNSTLFGITTMAVGALVLFAATSCGNGKSPEKNDKEQAQEVNEEKFETSDSEDRADFLVGAVSANMAEIQLGQLAIDRSANADIKTLARQLVKDHTVMLGELRDLAEKRGVTVPTALTDEDNKAVAKLNETKPGDFDKEWLKELEDRHKSSLKKYKKCAEKDDDMELRNLANKHIVHIEAHHHSIEAMLKNY